MNRISLGINIDHIATLRNARGENDPSLLEMLFEIQDGGAKSITMHLREDRRHIKDEDVFIVKNHGKLPINFEMALTREMVDIALELKPKSVCIVPEKRQELTTEGGLNINGFNKDTSIIFRELQQNNINIFLFVEPSIEVLSKIIDLGIDGVEVHTGLYTNNFQEGTSYKKDLEKIIDAAGFCSKNKIIFHAGHGLNYQNIKYLLNIENLAEVNIGHSVISRSLKVGLRNAVSEMNMLLQGNSR